MNLFQKKKRTKSFLIMHLILTASYFSETEGRKKKHSSFSNENPRQHLQILFIFKFQDHVVIFVSDQIITNIASTFFPLTTLAGFPKDSTVK